MGGGSVSGTGWGCSLWWVLEGVAWHEDNVGVVESVGFTSGIGLLLERFGLRSAHRPSEDSRRRLGMNRFLTCSIKQGKMVCLEFLHEHGREGTYSSTRPTGLAGCCLLFASGTYLARNLSASCMGRWHE